MVKHMVVGILVFFVLIQVPTSEFYPPKMFSSNSQQHQLIFLWLLLFLPSAKSLKFSFVSFDSNDQNIRVENDSYVSGGAVQLTRNQVQVSLSSSVGRVSYSSPVLLWDARTKEVTNFTTHFKFVIDGNETYPGDGMAFFLAPFNSSATAPPNSIGGCLGLVDGDNNTGHYQFVAVEFDTWKNSWDPSYNHVGIDVNSVVSSANLSWASRMNDGSKTANAWISYSSSTNNLSVFLTYDDNPIFNGSSSLWYNIDLSTVLPEQVRVGFSASTGGNFEVHKVLSWDFNSTLKVTNGTGTGTDFNSTIIDPDGSTTKSKAGLIGGIVAGTGVFLAALVYVGFLWRRKRVRGSRNELELQLDDDFEQGTGPGRFTYHELSQATNNFAEEGRLGEGGFGVVYRGALKVPDREIAVKKVSRRSKQGKKEYVSEVKIISRLRHRSLVQLLGWCHDQGDLLLVYEYMSNGSLDSHLYRSQKPSLGWIVRYKIAKGLASALLYLHEEWEQCVLHRDIKSSNVMLDSNFNAKLGDFGLARLVDHELGSQTTVLAGTLGYLAPECCITGKASKESDVYSFGVVALEIVAGRRPVESLEEPNKVRLVDWVWDLYGKGILLEAADKRLEGKFEKLEIECLMVVGLWCCHPDYTFRPSVRQVLNVLNFEAPLPSLPSELPVPIYLPRPVNSATPSTMTSSENTGSSGMSMTSSSSLLAVSGTSPLLHVDE